MKRNFLLTLILFVCTSVFAQIAKRAVNSKNNLEYSNAGWAVCTWSDAGQQAEICSYITNPQHKDAKVKAAPGYNRLFKQQADPRKKIIGINKSLLNDEELIPQPYGFRMADGCIYVYNYEAGKEQKAFDFNLKAGDHFTTCNGMEWVVDEVVDTTLTDTYSAQDMLLYQDTHKLLKVTSTDGIYHDQWLENVGSLSNFLLTDELTETSHSHTAWIVVDGISFGFNFSADPIYGYYMPWVTSPSEEKKPSSCKFEDNTLTFTCYNGSHPARYYYCFSRKGDDIYLDDYWYIPNGWAWGGNFYYDVVLPEMPSPAGGTYQLHWLGGQTYNATGITSTAMTQTQWPRYDLMGRPVTEKNPKGIHIERGRKYISK